MNSRVKVRTYQQRARAERQAQTRRQLLEAAATLFVAKGIDATTVDGIVRSAGFSRGAFYSNFADKSAVVIALLDDWRDQWNAQIARGEDPRLVMPAEDWMVIQTEAWLYAYRHPELRDRMRHIRSRALATGATATESLLGSSEATLLGVPFTATEVGALWGAAEVDRLRQRMLGLDSLADDLIDRSRQLLRAIVAASSPPRRSRRPRG